MTKTEASVFEGRKVPKIREYETQALRGDTDDGPKIGEKYAKSLIAAYLVKSFKFIGLKEDKFPDDATAKTFVSYIYRNHGWASPEEIFKAFEYAAVLDEKQSDKTKRMLDHYQGIGIQLISQVLNRYRSHAEDNETIIINKIEWYTNSHSSWVESRVKDNDAVSNALIKTFDEYENGIDEYTYLVLFPAFYDWLDYNGLITLTIDEKNQIAYKVKAARVDNFRISMNRSKVDALFNVDNIKQACKRKAIFEMLNLLNKQDILNMVNNTCYIAESAFEQLKEIIHMREKMKEGAND